jgi:hypothetical protein
MARGKAKEKDARDAALREAARKFDRLMRGDRDRIE